MFFFLLALCYLTFAVPSHAQIPLLFQLLSAYHSRSLANVSPPRFVEVSPSPGMVLGSSVTSPTPTLPPIGGDGKVYTIAFLGDSMIDTLGTDLPAVHDSLKKNFPLRAFSLLNYGVGSQNIESGLYRLTHSYNYQGKTIPSLISQRPDIIVVESFAYNNFGNTQSGYDRHWLALGAITSTIKTQLPQTKIIIAATIAPNSAVFSNGTKDLNLTALEKREKTSTIKLYLQNAINFAQSEGYPLADAYHPSLVNNEGSRQYINSVDNIHPSAAGASLFADTLANTISTFPHLIGL